MTHFSTNAMSFSSKKPQNLPFLLDAGLVPEDRRAGVGDPVVYFLQCDDKLSPCSLVVAGLTKSVTINHSLVSQSPHLQQIKQSFPHEADLNPLLQR